jgi:hypothetical protein
VGKVEMDAGFGEASEWVGRLGRRDAVLLLLLDEDGKEESTPWRDWRPREEEVDDVLWCPFIGCEDRLNEPMEELLGRPEMPVVPEMDPIR